MSCMLTITDGANISTEPILEFIKHLCDAFDVVVATTNEGNETFERVLLQNPNPRKTFRHYIHTITTICPGLV